MAKLKWNDQMAYLAQLNTKQCKMAHDSCRNTRKLTIMIGNYEKIYFKVGFQLHSSILVKTWQWWVQLERIQPKLSLMGLCKCGSMSIRILTWSISISTAQLHQVGSEKNLKQTKRMENNLKPFRTIGHFTAMMTDRSTDVGCAISSYKGKSGTNTFNYYLLACNYASTNILGCPVYKTGSSASSCTLGRDSTFTGLCNVNEPIDANILC